MATSSALLDVSAIPAHLADLPQWLVWNFEPGEKKPKKMPYYVSGQRRTGTQGSAEDRAQLVKLEVAYKRAQSGYSGVGFAFLPNDGLIGIDIDACIDAEGVVSDRATSIISACNSYTEFSPSRTGVHIIVAGETKSFKSNDIGLEVFCGRQFFTFTAMPFPGTPSIIAPIGDGVLKRLRVTVQGAAKTHRDRVCSTPQAGANDERSKIESALAVVSADCGYQEWINVGMAIFSALGDSGLAVWDWWSAKGQKYGGIKDLESHWKSFTGGGITSATIFRMAIDQGWRPPRPPGGYPRPALAMVPRLQDTSADPDLPPAPTEGSAEPVETTPAPVGLVSLEWALAHCALVQGSTDVWDSVNQLKMKRAAFTDLVGKESATVWTGHSQRRAISPRNLPKTVRGVAVQQGGRGDEHISMMLDRYTLLYGTKTVWDADKRTVIAYDAMALARGSDLATRWLEHPLRLEKDLDKLVFDPTQRVNLDTHINMFEGFLLKPKRDETKAQLALGLLYNLCSSEPNCDEVFHWVLCWLAYPLQHPGAKMQTALLFFGEKQGTGKSLFFEGIVKPIYGAHGATGGQHQLEAPYTHWRSQKLFVLFEEILSRQDKYSHFGLIKHMITGRDMPISQKFKDDRTEDNHMNVAMLSNEFQAVPIEPEDRRFQVVEARMMLEQALIDEIKLALEDGLSAAFYAFLLEYPLDGFGPHTKPLMTASKERMINFGRPDWEAFYLSWAAGDLAGPYCSCLSTDLYELYARYCSRYGFRALTLCKFAELIAQRIKKDRQWVTIGAKPKKLLTVFHVAVPDGKDESLSKQCERFRTLAEIKEPV